jgi:pimeloyl-ACP methyl ester carboxylesterase
MTMRAAYCDLEHGQLHYRCNEQRPGTPLLLLHQTPSDSRMYDKLMTELDARFWMIAPDNPGFGNSCSLPGGFSLEGCADAVISLLDQLRIDSCHVFGHHTGASIAVQIASQEPNRIEKLVLGGPTLLSEEMKQALPDKARPFPPRPDGSHLLGMWQRMGGKESDAPLELLLRETMAALAAGENYPRAYAAVIEQDFAGQLAALRCPTLVFAGTEDILHGCLQPSFELLARGTVAEFPRVGGYVCDRQPEQVAALLQEFLGE